MTGWIVLGCVLLFLLLLALLKVGVAVTYSDTLTLRVVAGPIKLTLLPAKKKAEEKPKKKKKKKPKPKKPEEEKPKEKPDVMALIQRFVPPALNAVNRFRKKLSIDRLILYYTVASGDPSATGINYGRTTAAVSVILPLLHRSFNIKRQDVRVEVSFETTKPVIFADVQLTIAIWQIFYVAFAMLPALFPPKKEETNKKETKETDNREEVNNGKTANQ